ncbi:hypothetical protein VTJ49DRAFT_4614 [Mycothermus thermophilus]|uniref:MICOS complex subunit MIC12 n=1 Tax=Humicola insolens TaxID=85995 RepID=A0ABR3V4Z3_HUMIN
MGFLAGFVRLPSLSNLLTHKTNTKALQTGGVTLTLSLTYLALLTHTRNREAQSSILRSQISTLDALVPPPAGRRNATVPLPDGTYRPRDSLEQYRPEAVPSPSDSSTPSRKERQPFLETAKTRWNSEILSAVHWAQTKDWARVREDAEQSLARLLGIELSRDHPVPASPSEQPAHHHHHHDPLGFSSSSSPENQPREPPPQPRRGKVSQVLHQTRDTTLAVAHAMRDEAKEIVAEAREVAEEAVQEAKEAMAHRKDAAVAATKKGEEKVTKKTHEVAGKAKAAVHLAEEKAEGKMEAGLSGLSDVERALAERYDAARREEKMKKSAEEVLKERYIPMEGGKSKGEDKLV